MTTSKLNAVKFLEKLSGGPLTLGRFLVSIRLGDEVSQVAFAKRFGISRQDLCDIEKSRAVVRPERAARWAKKLGYGEPQFVGLALQGALDAAGLALEVNVVAADCRSKRIKANVA